MAKKYYGIKKGLDPSNKQEVNNIIVESWDECLKYVKGVKGAIYKSFQLLEEVKSYLSEDTKILKKGMDNYPMEIPHAYVDGSFNSSTGKYGYGVVVIQNGVIIHIESGTAKDQSEKSLRQIAGELKAAIRATEFAVTHNFRELVIFHDYEGICHHATGSWDRKDKSSQLYFEEINRMKNENNLNIIFVKVDSHTNDFFNELADEEAKKGAELSISGSVDKLIKNLKIKVLNDKIKDEISELISSSYIENVKIENINIDKKLVCDEREKTVRDDTERILSFLEKESLLEYINTLDSNRKTQIIESLWAFIKGKGY